MNIYQSNNQWYADVTGIEFTCFSVDEIISHLGINDNDVYETMTCYNEYRQVWTLDIYVTGCNDVPIEVILVGYNI